MAICPVCNEETVTDTGRGSSVLCDTCNGIDHLPAEDQLDCFMTATMVKALDKPRDCSELESFRNFMDNWLIHRPLGKSIIDFYRSMTPAILEKLEKREDSEAFYFQLWNVYLSPCLEAIQSDNNHRALRIYLDAMKELLLHHAYDDG